MRIGQGEVVWELRGLTAELARVSARAEELWRGGSAARVSLPALRVERRRVLWRGSEEKAKEQAKWGAVVFVVPVRVLGEGGGLCSERSTAALRWQPRGRLWAAWRREGAPARVKKWWRRSSATRGC